MLRATLRVFLASLLLCGLVVVGAMAVAAQSSVQQAPCAPRAEIIDTLNSQYSETRRGVGFVSSSAVLEVFASDDGSFTVIVTDPQGLTCVLAAGQSWESVAPAIPGTDS